MTETTRGLWIRLTMYAAWLTVAAGAIGVLDPDGDTAAVGIALLLVTTIAGVLRPFPLSHFAVAAVAALIYTGLMGLRASAPEVDPDSPYLPAAAAGAVALAGAAIVGDLIRGVLAAYDNELVARQRVIEELETIDSLTGALKRAHAQRMINEEVERARRYNRQLALLILGPDQWAEIATARGGQGVVDLLSAAGAGLLEMVRTIDQVIRLDGGEFAILLPETGLEGAQIVAEKLTGFGTEIYEQEVRAGIAAFPEDQVTGPGLWEEAEEALSFARTAQIGIASRSLLS